MPLSKSDNPKADKALQDITDEGAGAPDAMIPMAEELPEKDDVQKATKAAMLAETGQEEAQEKLKAVKASPDAIDTPSGYAMSKVASISNNKERGEQYAREKSAKRWGYVTPDLQEK